MEATKRSDGFYGGSQMKRTNIQTMVQCATLIRSLWPYMIIAVFMGIVGHILATGISILAAKLLFDFTSALILVVFIFALARGIFRYVEQSLNHYIAFKMLASIRDQVFTNLRKICPAKLETKKKGDLISLITSDIELLEVFYAHTISPIFIAIGFSLCMILFFFFIDPILAVYALFSYLGIGVLVPIYISKVSKDLGDTYRKEAGELSSDVLETLRGMDQILQYHQQENRTNRLEKKTKTLLKTEKKMKERIGSNVAITNTLILLFDLGFLVLSLNQPIEASILSTIAFMSSFGPVVALAQLGSTLQNTLASANRVLDLIEEEAVVQEVQAQKEVSFDGFDIQAIDFRYDKEDILKELTLSIPKNTIFGIQGKSGSGKSTLLRLLMRFWDVQKGRIEIDQTNIKEINTKELRNLESFVMQDTHLFHDSIKNNIKIAKLDATDQEIIEACKKANIHDFIMSLDQGYETTVLELGDSLSSGEKQRIGLARAFLHDAECMLLDEPTSNLDSFNEAMILRSIYQEKQNKTIVFVSHRKSSLQIADTIYSLDQGRVS